MVEEAKDTKPLTQAEIYAKGRTGYSPSLSPKDVSVLESKYQKQSDILYQRRFGLVANTVKREVESTLNNAKNDYQQNIQQYQNEIKNNAKENGLHERIYCANRQQKLCFE